MLRVIGGAADELRFVAWALDVAAKKLEACRRPHPPLLDELLGQAATWRHQEASGWGEWAGWDEDAPMGPLLLTYSEAAHMTRLSVNTIERAARAGRLRVVREGRAVRIRPADLCAFIESLGTTPMKET